MSLLMHIYSGQASEDGFDVSEILHDVEYTTSIIGQPGKLTFILEKDPNEILQISVGNMVKLWELKDENKIPLFQGYVFTIGTDATEAYRIVAYDQMRYLQNHDDKFIDGSQTLLDIFKEICETCGIKSYTILNPSDAALSIRIAPHNFVDVSYFDILQYCIDEVNCQSASNKDNGDAFGTFYFVRDNFGTLELREVKFCGTHNDNGTPLEDYLIIGDESLLTDYQYSVNIDDNTFNEFYFVYSKKTNKQEIAPNKQVQNQTIVGAIQAGTLISGTNTVLDGKKIGEDTIPKYGKLRKYVNVSEIENKENLAEYMKLNVENFNQPSRSVQLTAIGETGLIAGDTFYLNLNKLKINYNVYIISATHRYSEEGHTMELDINTSSAMKVFS